MMTMFENTSYKVKICAYVYFIGNVVISVYRDYIQYIELGKATQVLISSILNSLHSFLMYFIISLVIYGFGKIVEYYELMNEKISQENKEKRYDQKCISFNKKVCVYLFCF